MISKEQQKKDEKFQQRCISMVQQAYRCAFEHLNEPLPADDISGDAVEALFASAFDLTKDEAHHMCNQWVGFCMRSETRPTHDDLTDMAGRVRYWQRL